MRLVLGLLLLLVWLPSGGATERNAWLAGVAGVPIQVFDLQAEDVSRSFRTFLSEVPMTNNRPLPAALIDDTVASLAFLKSVTGVDEPSYFVATYIQKTPLISSRQETRDRYLQRYGEEVFPQQICPVFLSRANADVPQLLRTALGLPKHYFASVKGSAENFDKLFALTEASHCGFIARELANPTVLPEGLSNKQMRAVLEALGDFEATAVFRTTSGTVPEVDEADVLFAGRLLATFFLDRENAYTILPGLLHEYDRIGVVAAHHQMARIATSVGLARRTVRSALDAGRWGNDLPSLEALRQSIAKAAADGELALDDPLAGELIAGIGPAIAVIQGNESPGQRLRRGSLKTAGGGIAGLVTLTGTPLLN